jgi:catechol 2,3-dioxygenase-like lactoylglutathione lyase family enzyme
MNLQKTFVVRAGVACLTAVALAACGGAVPVEPTGEVTEPAADAGLLNVSILHLNVEDMDRSLALYRDLLGMEIVGGNGGPSPTPIVADEGAMMHTVILEAPGGGFSMELVEVSGIELRPQQPRIQDPGAVMLAMTVSDLDVMLAGMKDLGLEVLSAGGEPVVTEGPDGVNRAVMVRDADGFVNYLTQSTDPAADTGSIVEVLTFLTVSDLGQTVAFYNGAFSFDMDEPGEAQPTSERIISLFDNPELATMRLTFGTFPGTDATLYFQEFNGADQNPVRHRVQDPGGPIFTMTVEDFPATIERIMTSGGIVGQGETSEMLAPDASSSWVRDPNGLLIRMSAVSQ